jgi:hypothetical protein
MKPVKEVDIVNGTMPFAFEIVDTEDEFKTAVIYSVIPQGLAVVDHHAFEGKKIVATKAYKEGDELYVGHAVVVDLSSANNAYTLRLYSENCGIPNAELIDVLSQKYVLVDEFQNNTVHSVLETGDATKRQVRNNANNHVLSTKYRIDGIVYSSKHAHRQLKKCRFTALTAT